MKMELEDGNYQLIISKLTKGSLEDKSLSLKKLLYLYENSRAKIYLYQRRITQSLELLLLIQQNDISLNALSLLEKIIINTVIESDLVQIIKKRLLSKIVLNLGSVEIELRKISHKCILEFVRKFKDYQSILSTYLKVAIRQADNYHLKLKSINSIHSLFMNQNKHFSHQLPSALPLIDELILSAHLHENLEVRKAALLCLIYLLRIEGSQNNLKTITADSQKALFNLTFANEQLASLLEAIMKYKYTQQSQHESQHQNAPSPKFVTLQNSIEQLKTEKTAEKMVDKISDTHLRVYNDVANAEQFLKKIQRNQYWSIQQIKDFSEEIQKYLVDQSIKLFSISKKIVQAVFDSDQGKAKQYYVILVPCVVNGIGSKRFIVRKNLDKLIRHYLKYHTEVWVQNFIQKFAITNDGKVKDLMIDLFVHAYRTSPQFYYPIERPFSVFDGEISDKNSNLKWKIIDCIIFVIQRQGNSQKTIEQMLNIFSPESYQKIMRKMNKAALSLGSNREGTSPQPQSPLVKNKKQRTKRLVTDDPILSNDLDQKEVSEGKTKPLGIKVQRLPRKSQIDIQFKPRRLQIQKKGREEKNSNEKLPQLRKNKGSYMSKNDQVMVVQSPIRRNIGQRSLQYIEKDDLSEVQDPKNTLDKTLQLIKDISWNTQFQSVNTLRSIIEYNQQIITDEYLTLIVSQLLQCLNSLRSGVTKISLICLCQLMQRFTKRLWNCTQNIILTILKKSAITSQFIQEEIRKSLIVSTNSLCLNRIINSVNNLRDTRAIQIKINILLIIDTIVKNEKLYRKQVQWIWGLILEYHDQAHNEIRNQCKKIVKYILQTYKDWKNEVLSFKKHIIDKVDKLLKSMNSKGSFLQNQNIEFDRLLANKVMTAKYFASQYSKFQEQDKALTSKKNWKDKIKLINDVFNSAFQHPSQFETNSNSKKYILIACEHIDQKNPGILLNSLNIIGKAVDYLPTIIEQCLGIIIQKNLIVIDSKRNQLVCISQRVLSKIYKKFQINKVLKELLKILIGNNLKVKVECLNQIIQIIKQNNISNTLQNLLSKVLNKLVLQKNTEIFIKVKELLCVCSRRLNFEFISKVSANQRLAQLLQ